MTGVIGRCFHCDTPGLAVEGQRCVVVYDQITESITGEEDTSWTYAEVDYLHRRVFQIIGQFSPGQTLHMNGVRYKASGMEYEIEHDVYGDNRAVYYLGNGDDASTGLHLYDGYGTYNIHSGANEGIHQSELSRHMVYASSTPS